MILTKLEQNKLTAAMFLSAMILLIIAVFSCPVFAWSDYPDSVTVAPICDLTADSFSSNGYRVSYSNSPSSSSMTLIGSYYDGDELVLVSSFKTANYLHIVRSFNQDSHNSNLLYRYSNGDIVSSKATSSVAFPDLASVTFNRSSGFTQIGPTFSSADEGLAAVRAAFNSYTPPSSSTTYPLSVSLPAGNMLIVDLDGFDYTKDRYWSANQTFEFGTTAGRSQNQSWGYLDSIDTIIFPIADAEYINWSGVGKQTPFGLYTSLSTTYALDSGLGRYVFVVNPYRPADPDEQSENPTLDIFFSQASRYQILELKVLWNSATGSYGGSIDGNSWTGNYDPETGLWDLTNNDPDSSATPSTGGGNAVSPQSTINDWLQNIAQNISSFFRGAIGAVTTLVAGGSAFISQLSALYSWLPSPVLSVLSAALILVITIGVIKVFI